MKGGLRRNPVDPMLGYSRKHFRHMDKRKQVKHKKLVSERMLNGF